jgi:hypothetical protein
MGIYSHHHYRGVRHLCHCRSRRLARVGKSVRLCRAPAGADRRGPAAGCRHADLRHRKQRVRSHPGAHRSRHLRRRSARRGGRGHAGHRPAEGHDRQRGRPPDGDRNGRHRLRVAGAVLSGAAAPRLLDVLRDFPGAGGRRFTDARADIGETRRFGCAAAAISPTAGGTCADDARRADAAVGMGSGRLLRIARTDAGARTRRRAPYCSADSCCSCWRGAVR